MSGAIDGVLAREHPAGAAESGEHFVGDEQRPVSIAEPSRARQKLARPDDHAAGRLQHRLDEDGGDAVAVALERRFEAAQAVDLAARPLETERAAIAVGRIGAGHPKQQRRERAREDRILADRHRADRVAVIRVVQRDERAPLGLTEVAPVLVRELQRDFDGRRSVVGVEDARQAGRQDLEEALREVDGRRMRAAGEHDVFEPLRLLGERAVQSRMRVAVDVHPPRRGAVEQPPAVLGVEVHALRSDDRQRRRRRRHLRVRVPQMRAVAFDEARRFMTGSSDGHHAREARRRRRSRDPQARRRSIAVSQRPRDPARTDQAPGRRRQRREAGHLSQHRDAAVVFDRRLVVGVRIANHHDAGDAHVPAPQGFERQQRVIDGAERGPRGDDDRQIQRRPSGRPSSRVVVDRHEHAARALDNPRAVVPAPARSIRRSG